MTSHEDTAKKLFLQGYNCAQSLVGAFAEDMGMDEKTAIKTVSALGGGMGRMREVCGAVSGMFIVLGVLYGYDNPSDNAAKATLYSRVQELAASFRAEHGSIVCRELLGIDENNNPIPTPRNGEFYKKRPCVSIVMDSARILSDFIEANPR